MQYGSNAPLQFTDKLGKQHNVKMHTKVKANNGDFLTAMALKGHGLVLLPTFIVYEDLAKGKLVTVLDDFPITNMHAHAVYPAARHLSQRCRFFIDYLVAQLGDSPYWDV